MPPAKKLSTFTLVTGVYVAGLVAFALARRGRALDGALLALPAVSRACSPHLELLPGTYLLAGDHLDACAEPACARSDACARVGASRLTMRLDGANARDRRSPAPSVSSPSSRAPRSSFPPMRLSRYPRVYM